MANIRTIRRRIRSAQNIAQITKAMEMVAASKMKKAAEAASAGKAYADKIYEATHELGRSVVGPTHPLLLMGDSSGKTLVIVISTNKGLCGGLNTNLFRKIVEWFPAQSSVEYVTVGKKAAQFITRSSRTLKADFSSIVPFGGSVPPITQLFVDGFITGTYNSVYIVYSGFINALKQEPRQAHLLPLTLINKEKSTPSEEEFAEFLIEPSVDEVLESLLPHYLENQLRSALFEAEASEHSARMIAMRNATDAAGDFTKALTLQLNKARQERITYEIADMITARMAVI